MAYKLPGSLLALLTFQNVIVSAVPAATPVSGSKGSLGFSSIR